MTGLQREVHLIIHHLQYSTSSFSPGYLYSFSALLPPLTLSQSILGCFTRLHMKHTFFLFCGIYELLSSETENHQLLTQTQTCKSTNLSLFFFDTLLFHMEQINNQAVSEWRGISSLVVLTCCIGLLEKRGQ